MPRASNEVKQYFQLLLEKKLTDAGKALEQIRQSFDSSESGLGYLKGLEGLLLGSRSTDDQYLYFNRIEMTSKHATEIKREFQAEATNELQAPYDKAYFEAMTDFMREIIKAKTWSKRRAGVQAAAEKPAEHQKSSTASL